MSRRATAIAALIAPALLAGCGATPRTPATPVGSAFVRVDAIVPTGRAPVAVAVGAGAVWVADNADGTVTRVDPETHRRQGGPIDVGTAPVAIVAGVAGVWVARATGDVVRIDPKTGRVAGPPVPVPDPGGIALTPGRVWVSSRSGNALVSIDARAGTVIGRTRVGARPTDVAADASGVWVANSADGTVTRVDPASRAAGAPIRVARHQALNAGDGRSGADRPGGAEVLALAVGQGGVWVAKTDSPAAATIQVRRIDPETRSLTGEPIRVNGGIPIHLAAGGGGVWATDIGSTLPGAPSREPGLQRIDPGTRRLASPRIRLGRNPGGIAVGATGVWVTATGENALQRIGPGSR